jgi:maleylpyruvate isomerase
LLDSLGRLGDADLDGPSLLPGWNRRQLLAHVACNAEALQRLVHWARTGEQTPMYASVEQRERDIADGAGKPAGELRAWVHKSAEALAADLDALPDESWTAQVRTSQGRLVPASEIPWLRAQEAFVHAIDLDAGTGFADLPGDFLDTLLTRVAERRSTKADGPALAISAEGTDRQWQVAGTGEPVPASAPVPVLAAWLTGRPVEPLPGPVLPPWL